MRERILPMGEEKKKEGHEIPYKPTNDLMFHMLFQRSENICRQFLAAVLGRKPEEITELEILNPIILGEYIEKKPCVLDIRLRINHGEQIGIEMQAMAEKYWIERSLYYLCRSFTDLNRGVSYGELKPTIHIGILDFTLFPENTSFFSQFGLLNKKTYQPYSDKLSLYVLELRKLENIFSEEEKGLHTWARMFKAQTWEELDMLEKENPASEEFKFILKDLNADEKLRLECEAREREEMDRKSAEDFWRKEGKEETQKRINQLTQKLLAEKRYDDLEKAAKDVAYQEKLLTEFNI